MDDSRVSCELPGFRFHPTEEELVDFYLRNVIFGKKWEFDVIGFLNIYRYPPWDLPGLAKIGEREWYFFVQRDRKQSNGGRLSRTTEHGFWKATGSDRKVVTLSNPKRVIGYKKTLVFYKGRAPKGIKTDWVMNEYRFPDNWQLPKDIVLCKVYMKATSLKVLEQWATKEEVDTLLINSVQFSDNSESSFSYPSSPPPPLSHISNSVQPISTSHVGAPPPLPLPLPKDEKLFEDNNEEDHFKVSVNGLNSRRGTSLKLPFGSEELPDLQVPCFGMDWAQAQDHSSAQIRSPWLDNILNQFTLTPPPNLLSIIE